MNDGLIWILCTLGLLASLAFGSYVFYRGLRAGSFRVTKGKVDLDGIESLLDQAENARKWYLQSVESNLPSKSDALGNMVSRIIKAVATFAVQEVKDGKVSKRPVRQLERIESLLESALMGMRSDGFPEEYAIKVLQDETTLMLHSFELKDMIPQDRILLNPAEQYFELRDNRL